MAASLCWGFIMGSRDRYRMRDLNQLKSAFLVLKAEIDFGLNQLKEAMEAAGNKINKPVSDIFINFSRNIEDSKATPNAVWLKALESVTGAGLSNEDLEALKDFGRALGFLDKSMQINNIEAQIHYIDEKLLELKESSAKNFKLYNSLGLLCGLMAVVILL
jgi:stage III sporulation protein AB